MKDALRIAFLLGIFLSGPGFMNLSGFYASHAAPKTPSPIGHGAISSVKLSVKEASGIAALPPKSPGQGFLVVDDDAGLFQVFSDGTANLLLSGNQKSLFRGLEGITLSTDKRFVYCLEEGKGRVIRIPLDFEGSRVVLGHAEEVGRLPGISDKPNKGWEGITICFHQGREFLLAVHQESPRSLGLFGIPDLKPLFLRKLSHEAVMLLENLSDVAFDHRTGHLLLLSSKSRRLVEIGFPLEADSDPGKVFAVRDLPLGKDEKPEGVCFDSSEGVVIVTDGGGKPGKLLRLPAWP